VELKGRQPILKRVELRKTPHASASRLPVEALRRLIYGESEDA
jgi:hypothetical protein